jgi:hypothetical protein
MKTFLALLMCLCVAVFAQNALTNDSVIKMVKAGLGDDVIVNTIKSQLGLFKVGADDLISLKQAGVSDKVIGAMLDKTNVGLSGNTSTPDPQPAPSPQPTTPQPAPPTPVPAPLPQPGPVYPAPGPDPGMGGGPTTLTAGAKIFIAPMDNGLDGFISAEIIKQHLPLTVVTQEGLGDFVMAGASLQADNHWYNTVFGGKDKNEGNVRVMNTRTKQMVWAGEAGDRSMWFGGLKRGGQRKVAERIVSKLKKDMFR